jgi:hypothetical protein
MVIQRCTCRNNLLRPALISEAKQLSWVCRIHPSAERNSDDRGGDQGTGFRLAATSLAPIDWASMERAFIVGHGWPAAILDARWRGGA